MNYIYEQLREGNKIYEINLDKYDKSRKSMTRDNSMGTLNNRESFSNKVFNNSPDVKNKKKQALNRDIQSHIVLNVRNENLDEHYIMAKNYIKALKETEFYML